MHYLKKKAVIVQHKHDRRKHRVNTKLKALHPDARVVVSRSNLYISGQIIDINGNVIAFVHDKAITTGTKVERAEKAGMQLAEIAKEKGLTSVVFDRNGYLYHGRVKAFAEGMRKGGLKL